MSRTLALGVISKTSFFGDDKLKSFADLSCFARTPTILGGAIIWQRSHSSHRPTPPQDSPGRAPAFPSPRPLESTSRVSFIVRVPTAFDCEPDARFGGTSRWQSPCSSHHTTPAPAQPSPRSPTPPLGYPNPSPRFHFHVCLTTIECEPAAHIRGCIIDYQILYHTTPSPAQPSPAHAPPPLPPEPARVPLPELADFRWLALQPQEKSMKQMSLSPLHLAAGRVLSFCLIPVKPQGSDLGE